MATSGTYTWDLEVHEIIEEAFQLATGQEHMTGKDARDARRALNLLLRDLENKGVPLASLVEKTVSLVDGTGAYTLDAEVLEVLDVVIRDADSNDTTLKRLSISDFHKISDKTKEGTPTQFFIDRQKDALTMDVWPIPDASTDSLVMWTMTKIQDVTGAAQNLDLHQRFLPALTYGLAYHLLLKKKDPTEMETMKRRELKQEYLGALQEALAEDRERVRFRVKPVVKSGYRRR